ncbi:MAG: type II toxin-antitoxin system ParD family antitoxin [Terracidiphilus sp.]
MPDRVVSLPPDMEDFVLSSVESGRFESTNEVVRAALLALHREQKAAADRQLTSAIAEGDVFRKLWDISAESAFSPSRR